jgi:hypothetical protein
MFRFWRYVSLVAVSLAGLATFLFYVPKIVSDTIPFLEGIFRPATQKQISGTYNDGNNGNKGGKPREPQAILDDRYVLPAGVTTREFVQCLSTKALVDGRDFTVKEVSSVYRVLIPTRPDDVITTGYDECRDRLRR